MATSAGPANPPMLQLNSDVQEARKKAQLYKGLLQNAIGVPSCRVRISLNLPNFATDFEAIKALPDGQRYSLLSESAEAVSGFNWSMEAFGDATSFGLYFTVRPSMETSHKYFRFNVNYCLRLFGSTSDLDLFKRCQEIMIADDVDTELISWKLYNEQDMESFPDRFIQRDGSIQIELDFSVERVEFEEEGVDENDDETLELD